jgi:hypothetical protein
MSRGTPARLEPDPDQHRIDDTKPCQERGQHDKTIFIHHHLPRLPAWIPVKKKALLYASHHCHDAKSEKSYPHILWTGLWISHFQNN